MTRCYFTVGIHKISDIYDALLFYCWNSQTTPCVPNLDIQTCLKHTTTRVVGISQTIDTSKLAKYGFQHQT